MLAIYLDHVEESRKEGLFRAGERSTQSRGRILSGSTGSGCVLSNGPSLLPGFSLQVQQSTIGCSAIIKMFHICTAQYNRHWRKVAT